eukprot:6724934-Pyramimonas_sp.AAC.1
MCTKREQQGPAGRSLHRGQAIPSPTLMPSKHRARVGSCYSSPPTRGNRLRHLTQDQAHHRPTLMVTTTSRSRASPRRKPRRPRGIIAQAARVGAKNWPHAGRPAGQRAASRARGAQHSPRRAAPRGPFHAGAGDWGGPSSGPAATCVQCTRQGAARTSPSPPHLRVGATTRHRSTSICGVRICVSAQHPLGAAEA